MERNEFEGLLKKLLERHISGEIDEVRYNNMKNELEVQYLKARLERGEIDEAEYNSRISQPDKKTTNSSNKPVIILGIIILVAVIGFLIFSNMDKDTDIRESRTESIVQDTGRTQQRQDSDRQASQPNPGQRREFTVRGVKFAVRYIPPGTFTMGSPESEAGRSSDERQHRVTISRGFWMMETEVTQQLYEAVMGSNPSDRERGIGPNHPVNRVSWYDAVEFCEILSLQTGMTWTLPTEAEWEYACRAGTTTPFHYGNRLDSSMANFHGQYPYGGASKGVNRARTVPVKSFSPNAWGLYDMHGNVWEWCADWYDAHYNYQRSPSTDPKGPPTGQRRTLRGGSWLSLAQHLRSAYRGDFSPDSRYYRYGFRAVLR